MPDKIVGRKKKTRLYHARFVTPSSRCYEIAMLAYSVDEVKEKILKLASEKEQVNIKELEELEIRVLEEDYEWQNICA